LQATSIQDQRLPVDAAGLITGEKRYRGGDFGGL
jgi:hypothetical protein